MLIFISELGWQLFRKKPSKFTVALMYVLSSLQLGEIAISVLIDTDGHAPSVILLNANMSKSQLSTLERTFCNKKLKETMMHDQLTHTTRFYHFLPDPNKGNKVQMPNSVCQWQVDTQTLLCILWVIY